MSRKIPPPKAFDGALCALDNADSWFRDSQILLKSGSVAHAGTLALIGAEELGKAIMWTGVPFVPLDKMDVRGLIVSGPEAHRAKLGVAVAHAIALREIEAETARACISEKTKDEVARQLPERVTWTGPNIMVELSKALRQLGIDLLRPTMRIAAALSHLDELVHARFSGMYVDWSDETGLSIPSGPKPDVLRLLLDLFCHSSRRVRDDIAHMKQSKNRRARRIGAHHALRLRESADELAGTPVYIVAKAFPEREASLLYLETIFRDRAEAQQKADELNAKDVEEGVERLSLWEVTEEVVPAFLAGTNVPPTT